MSSCSQRGQARASAQLRGALLAAAMRLLALSMVPGCGRIGFNPVVSEDASDAIAADARPPIPTMSSAASTSIATLDIDGDAVLDVVVVLLNQRMEVFHGNNDGTFAPVREIPLITQPHPNPLTIAVGNLDSDSWADVVVAADRSYAVIGNHCLR